MLEIISYVKAFSARGRFSVMKAARPSSRKATSNAPGVDISFIAFLFWKPPSARNNGRPRRLSGVGMSYTWAAEQNKRERARPSGRHATGKGRDLGDGG